MKTPTKRLTRLGIVIALVTVMLLSIPVFADRPGGSQSRFCKALVDLPIPEAARSVLERLFNCDCPPNCPGE